MNSRRVLGIWAVLCGAMLAAAWPQTGLAQSGHEVSACYRITETTSLGDQVRVAMHIRLNNHTEEQLLVTGVALRGVLPETMTPEENVSVYLRAHGGKELKQSFTVARAEYEQWEKGGRPRLFLRMQGPDGRGLTRTVTTGHGQAVPMEEN